MYLAIAGLNNYSFIGKYCAPYLNLGLKYRYPTQPCMKFTSIPLAEPIGMECQEGLSQGPLKYKSTLKSESKFHSIRSRN